MLDLNIVQAALEAIEFNLARITPAGMMSIKIAILCIVVFWLIMRSHQRQLQIDRFYCLALLNNCTNKLPPTIISGTKERPSWEKAEQYMQWLVENGQIGLTGNQYQEVYYRQIVIYFGRTDIPVNLIAYYQNGQLVGLRTEKIRNYQTYGIPYPTRA